MKYYIAEWIKADGTKERGMYEDDSMRGFRQHAKAMAKRNGWTLVGTASARSPHAAPLPAPPVKSTGENEGGGV